jgi:ribosomal protein S18 acetylase RimI-like enzyme
VRLHHEPVEIAVEGAESLAAYASIPIAFQVLEVLDLDSPANSDALLPFQPRSVAKPIEKDYDGLLANSPLDWSSRFDVSDWAFIAAYRDGRRVGGAVVITKRPDIDMMEGRDDVALLWDIRVIPDMRGQGVGSALLNAAESRAVSRNAKLMKIETQNTNVPACRFYARHGFTLGGINREAYPGLPDEVQLLWYKDIR